MKLAWMRCRLRFRWPGIRPGAEVGEAGASARAFYDRLRRDLPGAKPTRRARATRAVAGVLVAVGVLAVVGLALRAGLAYAVMVATFVAQQLREWRCRRAAPADPARAWRRGAQGERRTAKRLRPLTHQGWVVLHDRVIPGFPGNVDHLVIGPTGVFVVDSKLWSGRAVTVDDGVLFVGGYPVDLRPTLWEAEHVAGVLADELRTEVAVVAVICVHGAFFPGNGYALAAVDVVPGRELCRYLQRPRPSHLHRAAIVRLAAAAEARLPAAA